MCEGCEWKPRKIILTSRSSSYWSRWSQVIQKLLERVPSEHITLVKAFAGNVLALATHTYGCRVLQRCFEHVKQDQMETLLEELHHHAMSLMVDQFGVSIMFFSLQFPFILQILVIELCDPICSRAWANKVSSFTRRITSRAPTFDGQA